MQACCSRGLPVREVGSISLDACTGGRMYVCISVRESVSASVCVCLHGVHGVNMRLLCVLCSQTCIREKTQSEEGGR